MRRSNQDRSEVDVASGCGDISRPVIVFGRPIESNGKAIFRLLGGLHWSDNQKVGQAWSQLIRRSNQDRSEVDVTSGCGDISRPVIIFGRPNAFQWESCVFGRVSRLVTIGTKR